MRRLVVQEFVTIDGLAVCPESETDFIPTALQRADLRECPLHRPWFV
jgi:hypothetical protein